MIRSIACTLAAATLLAAPVASIAQTSEQRTVGVNVSDLDLTTESGRHELERRIENAARDACAIGETDLGTRVMTREKRACYRDARQTLDRHFARVVAASNRDG